MKIGILTNFKQSKPEYSLYSVVVAQADALTAAGNSVSVFAAEGYEQTQPLPPCCSFSLSGVLPAVPLTDYQSEADLSEKHREYVHTCAQHLSNIASDHDVLITHDWVFTGWNLPYFLAIEAVADQTRRVRWLHWVHSIPGLIRDWWQLQRLGESNHRLVYPNRAGRERLARAYRTEVDKTVTIPHIVDLRHLLRMSRPTCEILDRHPEIVTSNIVQVYPAGSDRLDAKGVRELLGVMGRIKARGWSVCVVIVNSYADKNRAIQDKIDHYKRLAEDFGLCNGTDVVWMSDEGELFRAGTPKQIVGELMAFGNVFIFPTQEETFGLVLPEALLASGALPVINKSLLEQVEVAGGNGILVDFGSYNQEWVPNSDEAWWDHLAGVIVGQLLHDESVKSRTWFRRRLNRETVYNRYYVPVVEGSALW